MKVIKICFFVIVTVALITYCLCMEVEKPVDIKREPVILMYGNNLDSVYLYIPYSDPGATITDNPHNVDYDNRITAASGTVNTHIPGTYYLTYEGTGSDGEILSPVTRTVHVMENPIGFLNGVYDAVCTCTAIGTSKTPTISVTNYSATVFPENARNYFKLVPVLLGGEFVSPNTYLYGDSIDGGYFSCDYHKASLSGRLFPSKDSFALHTDVYQYSPQIKYACTSIYKKRLILARQKN